MASAEQLKALIKAHFSDQHELFNTCALQIAAHEAKLGHGTLAVELRKIIDGKRKPFQEIRHINLPPELQGLVLAEDTNTLKSSLVIKEPLMERLQKIILEYWQRGKLKLHGLVNRRKLLLIGPPGTGKTLTAQVLAKELSLSLNTIQVDRLVTKFMGETSSKLRQIFDLMTNYPGVYLFDEFDAIGGERSFENDVGEMRRVLNTFLQFIEQDNSPSIIIAATNNPRLLDQALFRRFDDVLYYELPQENERKQLMMNLLATYRPNNLQWKDILEVSGGLCHAEIAMACVDAVKTTVLNDIGKVDSKLLREALEYRKNAKIGISEAKQ